MTTPGGHRPINNSNNFPPNYNPNPNFIADNLQNLQLNHPPNAANVANGPRGPPGPPGVGPRGSPQGTLPNRPAGGNVGPRPGPFASSGPPVPMLGSGVMSNGPPPRQTMSSFWGGGIGSENQIGPSFGAPPRGSGPPMFSAPPPPGSAYGTQPWQMQSRQNVPPPPIPGPGQPPRMYGMPPPLPTQQSMATISPAMGPSGNAVSGPSKIDPNQIPRPGPTSSVLLHETRQGNQANPPLPATTEFIVRDTGNCSPRYMRSTINQIPCTSDLLTSSGMQLALLVQPLALPHPEEELIQIVDFGEGGPVRCSRCKGYINPFMKFVDQGRRFVCNFCGFTDETPRDYQCNLGPDGRRRDADERPELCRGTVEFVATREFLVREPMPAVFFFLIDVSMNALQTGATAGACSAISQVIADLPDTDGSVIPPPIPLSSEHVNDDGIYLLENGEDCLIYVGGSVDPDITQKLFGVSSFSEIPSQLVLKQYENPLSKKLNEVVNEIRSQRCNYLRLKLCKKGEPSGMTFFSYMVEDKSRNSPSYVQFLVHVHRQIQTKWVDVV